MSYRLVFSNSVHSLTPWAAGSSPSSQSRLLNEDKTISEVIAEFAAKTGENIVVSRFVRFAVGEGAEAQTEETEL